MKLLLVCLLVFSFTSVHAQNGKQRVEPSMNKAIWDKLNPPVYVWGADEDKSCTDGNTVVLRCFDIRGKIEIKVDEEKCLNAKKATYKCDGTKTVALEAPIPGGQYFWKKGSCMVQTVDGEVSKVNNTELCPSIKKDSSSKKRLHLHNNGVSPSSR